MIVSEARREANRRNARLSTGPRTEAGKDRSRRNALTHGLSAEVVRLPEDEPAGSPAADPTLDWPGFLAEQVGAITAKLRRCDRLERRYRERIVHRAEAHWDDDRRLEAEFLGSGIARDPAAVARMLRMSPHGCDWMAERWALLARAADREGSWTAEQAGLAFDLLGTPREFRAGEPGERIDLEGRPESPTPAEPDRGGLARREVAALLARKAETARLDAFDRELARADADDESAPDLRKLRRHEADLHRRLRWCVAQLDKAATPPPPAPSPLPPPPPPAPPRPRPEPLADPIGDSDLDLDTEPFEAVMAKALAILQADALLRANAPVQSIPEVPPPSGPQNEATGSGQLGSGQRSAGGCHRSRIGPSLPG